MKEVKHCVLIIAGNLGRKQKANPSPAKESRNNIHWKIIVIDVKLLLYVTDKMKHRKTAFSIKIGI